MQAVRFGDVLDATLRRNPPGPPPAAPGILTAALYAAPFGAAWRGASAFRLCPDVPMQPAAAHPDAASRLLRPRTRAEQDAFRRFNEAGGNLAPSFTVADLKRGYRRLARNLHPDRHTLAPPAERARLSDAFVEVRQGYLTLAALDTD